MNLDQLLHNPAVVTAAWWLLSSAIQTMPEPTTTSSPGYLWLYRFLHILGANWSQVMAKPKV